MQLNLFFRGRRALTGAPSFVEHHGCFGWGVFVPLSNVWVTLLAVVSGGTVYGVIVLKLNRKICGELRGIIEEMGVVLPRWL
ncbi:hypothetical protein KAR91_39800 [Candidatus Pacearchaeota archaeon]|nr:hypothetical protein [Candidatus Pacearchaeota archaeon]